MNISILFSKFSERDGWGEPFDGTKLSINGFWNYVSQGILR